MDDFDRLMTGIEINRYEAFLDELPGAYKDIDLVMEQSEDLVEVLHTFRQIVNVKGAQAGPSLPLGTKQFPCQSPKPEE